MSEITTFDSLARRRKILAETSRAAAAAHDAHLRDALDESKWERRGVLRTLSRRQRSDDRAD
jgi:hypothetical protein